MRDWNDLQTRFKEWNAEAPVRVGIADDDVITVDTDTFLLEIYKEGWARISMLAPEHIEDVDIYRYPDYEVTIEDVSVHFKSRHELILETENNTGTGTFKFYAKDPAIAQPPE